MSKKVLYIIVGIVLLLVGALSYALLRPPSNAYVDETSESSNKTSTTETQTPEATNKRTGLYVDYSEDAVSNATGTKLLFFHAPWCPQCREMDASIRSVGVPSDVTVFKIDYDSNQALRQKYGVTLQTTFVKIDDQGNKIASYVAYDEPQFSSVQRELLQ